MQESFRVCHNYRDKDHFGSTIDMMIGLMGNMEVVLMVVTCQIRITQSDMEGSLTLRIGEMMGVNSILVLVLKSAMIVIILILKEGVIGDIF